MTQLKQLCQEEWLKKYFWTLYRSDLQLTQALVWGYCCQRRFNQLLNQKVHLIFIPALWIFLYRTTLTITHACKTDNYKAFWIICSKAYFILQLYIGKSRFQPVVQWEAVFWDVILRKPLSEMCASLISCISYQNRMYNMFHNFRYFCPSSALFLWPVSCPALLCYPSCWQR